jgi:hypothetical protein
MDYRVSSDTAEVGQEVGIARNTRYGFQGHCFGSIVKINGHGHIFVTSDTGYEMRFDKRGNSYKSDYGPRLYGAEYIRKDMAEELKQKQQRAAAVALQDAIKNNYAGNGRYWNTVDSVAHLKQLLGKLEQLVD